MKLVVISPEALRADEASVVGAMFAAGLERYHLRKPGAPAAALAAWIERLPREWRGRVVLHQHHALVEKYGLGGRHWRDEAAGGGGMGSREVVTAARPEASPYLTSRSCHDLASLRGSLGRFDAVFFGPVFPSISKPGYAPKDVRIGEALGALLLTRDVRERRTAVIAIGGITAETAPRARELGFDGVAALGAVWQAADPLAAFRALQSCCGDPGHAAAIGAAGRARRPRRAAPHPGRLAPTLPRAAAAAGTVDPAPAPAGDRTTA